LGASGAFWRLPYSPGGLQISAMATAHTRPHTISPGPAVSILVADDFSPWRAKVRDILRARPQWTIACEACDGQQAVQKAAALRPDVVLLDLGMPGLNGIEATKKIRERSPESRVVILTQCSDPDIKDVSLQVGAEAYVVKTKAASELLPTIEAALRRTREFRSPRFWRLIANEVTREEDPIKLTELVEELNQALTEQDINGKQKPYDLPTRLGSLK
jgi:DNA-binding NarL/FixJ family response regulator